MVNPITPPSAGSKRPSLDGGDDTASKRMKGKQLYTSPTKPAPNSHVLDKIPTRQRLAFDATDEPYLCPDDDDDDIIITKVSVVKPNPTPRAVSPTKTSFKTSFGASTVFTRTTEQTGYSQSTTVAPAASAAPKTSTFTFQGSTKRPTKTSLPVTPPTQRYHNAGPVGTRPSSASSSEYQTATDRSYQPVPQVRPTTAFPSPVSPPTPTVLQPIETREYIPTGPLKERLQKIWRKLSVKLRKSGDPLPISLTRLDQQLLFLNGYTTPPSPLLGRSPELACIAKSTSSRSISDTTRLGLKEAWRRSGRTCANLTKEPGPGRTMRPTNLLTTACSSLSPRDHLQRHGPQLSAHSRPRGTSWSYKRPSTGTWPRQAHCSA